MPMNRIPVFGLSLIFLSALAACGRDDPTHNVNQTKFPGQVTAGGNTSGEVMARNTPATTSHPAAGTPGIPQGSGGTTGGTATAGTTPATTSAPANPPSNTVPNQPGDNEGVRGQTPGGTGASGTPGIPEGAGGTPSGAEMGGTTPGAAATQVPESQNAKPISPGVTPAQKP